MSSAARKVTRATEGQAYGSNDPTGLNPLGGLTITSFCLIAGHRSDETSKLYDRWKAHDVTGSFTRNA